MAGTQQQIKDSGGSGTSHSVTYDSTPTSGNLLIAGISVDKSSGTITIPTGWGIIGLEYVSSSVSGAWAWKKSDGTEGAVQFDWVTTRGNSQMYICEYSGLDTLDVETSDDSGASAVSSQSTGTTATTAVAAARAFAQFGADTFGQVFNGRAYSNSFNEQSIGSTSIVGCMFADLSLSSTGTQECTYSHTDTGDQMYGKIAVFNLGGSPPATGGPKGPFTHPLYGPFRGPIS